MADQHDLVSEMRHRVDNDLALICAVVDRQRRRLDVVTAGEALDEVAGAIMAMALLYRQLYELDRTEALVDLSGHLRALTSGLRTAYLDRLDIRVVCSDAVIAAPPEVVRDIGLIVTDLVCNAAKHAFRGQGGQVSVTVDDSDDGLVFAICDDGCGLDAAPAVGSGAGLALSRRLAQGLGGRIEVDRRRPEGAAMLLTIPMVRPASTAAP